MPPKTWEDESDESSSGSEEEPTAPVVPTARRKFDDEEDSDDVVDSWDAEDSEEERKKVAKAAAAKAKADAEAAANKKSKSQRIEEHREEARRRRAAEEDDETSEDDDEDETAKRARLRQTEQDADLKHAQDLLGSVGLGAKTRSNNKAIVIDDQTSPGQAIDLSQLALFKPTTKTQFEALSSVLVPLLTASASKPHYALWVQDFVKKITAPLPSTDIKKAASGLTAQSNEKMKEEKNQDKGGKKSKAAKSKATLSAGRDVGRGVADTTAYDDGLEEEDFM